jgi:hypothetical protein
VQTDPNEYRQLDLRAHSLLADVPLHDVWLAELEGGGEHRTMKDVRVCFTPQTATTANASVRTLFATRAFLGRIFGWDTHREHWEGEYYRNRLTDEDRARSLVAPGTRDGILNIVYVFDHEALSEIRNATVHAFSCFALRETLHGYRLYWAIYVRPIGRWTPAYMRLIDPFRRNIVYPTVIARIKSEWQVRFADS